MYYIIMCSNNSVNQIVQIIEKSNKDYLYSFIVFAQDHIDQAKLKSIYDAFLNNGQVQQDKIQCHYITKRGINSGKQCTTTVKGPGNYCSKHKRFQSTPVVESEIIENKMIESEVIKDEDKIVETEREKKFKIDIENISDEDDDNYIEIIRENKINHIEDDKNDDNVDDVDDEEEEEEDEEEEDEEDEEDDVEDETEKDVDADVDDDEDEDGGDEDEGDIECDGDIIEDDWDYDNEY